MLMPSKAVSDRVQELAQALLARLTAVEQSLDHAQDVGALYAELTQALDECLNRLSQLAQWGTDNRLPSSVLWNVAGHLLSRGWLENQARTKPRGYAGDYEMLARIYENRLCDDPLGRLLDRYFQSQAAPQAVRNRMKMIADWMVGAIKGSSQSTFHVAIVGSALGLDVRDALWRLSSADLQKIEVTLLDLDPAAIEFAGQQLAGLVPSERLTARAANLFRFAERPQIASLLKPADLLFCPGLFDYLNDAEAAAMLQALYQRLAPGGRLTVFQFAPHNPTRAYMEWLGNWYLTYRDAGQLETLVYSAGIDTAQFGAEPLGVDLYATMTRPPVPVPPVPFRRVRLAA